ncbi:hypothetical protein F4809DRAFT_592742 [Biscogniauxia mediterranea]|nr:hypothetical protein F4809DRAFT_592742 [Biscogniauxia mediterranea]
MGGITTTYSYAQDCRGCRSGLWHSGMKATGFLYLFSFSFFNQSQLKTGKKRWVQKPIAFAFLLGELVLILLMYMPWRGGRSRVGIYNHFGNPFLPTPH